MPVAGHRARAGITQSIECCIDVIWANPPLGVRALSTLRSAEVRCRERFEVARSLERASGPEAEGYLRCSDSQHGGIDEGLDTLEGCTGILYAKGVRATRRGWQSVVGHDLLIRCHPFIISTYGRRRKRAQALRDSRDAEVRRMRR